MLKKLKNILKSEIDPAFEKRAWFIFQSVEKYKPKKVLDVGCGRGFYLKALSFYSFLKEIHGVDINNNYLNIARKICDDKRITIRKANVYSLPYPAKYFDFIIASEILEHLKDDKKALLELKRVLKPEGILVITVPNYNFPFLWDPTNWLLMKIFKTHINKNIWWLAGIWADHERLYSVNEIIKLISACNLKIVKLKKVIHHCIPFSHFLLYGIGKNLVERLGLKKFDRFNFNSNKNTVLPYIFRFLSLRDKMKDLNKSSVNICLIVNKI